MKLDLETVPGGWAVVPRTLPEIKRWIVTHATRGPEADEPRQVDGVDPGEVEQAVVALATRVYETMVITDSRHTLLYREYVNDRDLQTYPLYVDVWVGAAMDRWADSKYARMKRLVATEVVATETKPSVVMGFQGTTTETMTTSGITVVQYSAFVVDGYQVSLSTSMYGRGDCPEARLMLASLASSLRTEA